MLNIVKCPLCNETIPVADNQTRSDALMEHLREVKHNGEKHE